MKSIMLREVKIYALKPYPLFIKDIAKKDENILEIKDVTLDEDEKKRIANENTTSGNVLAGTPLAHPFTFLYDQYSRKAKLNRQYANLLEHEDELTELTQKYNPEIVEKITKLKGNQL
jgi:hypothetical protein